MASFYPFLYFACAALIAVSCAVVFRHNPKNPVNRKYVLFCIPFLIWLFIYSFVINTHLPLPLHIREILCKLAYTGIAFIPVTLLDYIFTFFEKNKLGFIKTGYVITILLAGFIWGSPLIIDGFLYYPWGIYPKAGLLHPLFLLFFFTGLVIFLYETTFTPYSVNISEQKSRQSKFLAPFYLLLCFDSIDFIPNYGVNVYPVRNFSASLTSSRLHNYF